MALLMESLEEKNLESMNGITFLYFSYGPAHIHYRAIFSIMSLALNYRFKPTDVIIIYTNCPDLFESPCRGLPVNIQSIGESDVIQMMGGMDLIHRVKIGIISRATQLRPSCKLIYVDADTFFTSPVEGLIEKINPNQSAMHCFEFCLNTVNPEYPPRPTTYEFSRMVLSDGYYDRSGPVSLSPMILNSWNAGLIGLDPVNFKHLPFVVSLTDQWYKKVNYHGAEQFAFSFVLETKTSIATAEAYCCHYWFHVKKRIVDESLAQVYKEGFFSLPQEKSNRKVAALIQYFQNAFHGHVYFLHNDAIASFLEGNYWKGIRKSLKLIIRRPPIAWRMIKDVGYYTKIKFFATK